MVNVFSLVQTSFFFCTEYLLNLVYDELGMFTDKMLSETDVQILVRFSSAIAPEAITGH